MTEQINYVTKSILRACKDHSKNNEAQYEVFMKLLKRANPQFKYTTERYLALKRALNMYWFDRDSLSKYQYEQKVHELLGFSTPICIL